jgi:hypothetical protein
MLFLEYKVTAGLQQCLETFKYCFRDLENGIVIVRHLSYTYLCVFSIDRGWDRLGIADF